MKILSYTNQLLSIPGLLVRVKRKLKTQRQFLQQEAGPVLRQYLQQNDGSLDEQDIRKIEKYYGLAVPAILGEAFAALRCKPLNQQERSAATWLGATTGLFDDLFDRRALDDVYIENLYRKPLEFTGANTNEKLLNHCWRNALEKAANADLLTEMAGRVHRSQIESRRQRAATLSIPELEQITIEKGGCSVLFYMSLFFREIPPEASRLFYNVGALLQLENDLFDVYRDSRDGIQTLVTGGIPMAQIRKLYRSLWEKVQDNIEETLYPARGKALFRKMTGALVCRGFVCLHMLQEREKQQRGQLDPMACSRKELICDMEKPANFFRTIHYFACMG